MLTYSNDAIYDTAGAHPYGYLIKKTNPDGSYTTYEGHYDKGPNPDPAEEQAEWVKEYDTFIKGANLPWVNYGYDIGNDGMGFSTNAANLAALNAELAKWQGDYVRIFLFTDLRSGIIFDVNGVPTGFTDKVYADMQALLAAAAANNVKLMPVLFDYLLADGDTVGGGLGEHADLITDPTKRAALVSLFVNFMQTFGNDPSIYAWDIMNEPEFADGAGVNISLLQDFVGAFIAMIHAEAPGSLVTVGSRNWSDMIQYWTGLGLDIYQFHYYDEMAGTNPLNHMFTQAELALLAGKPVIAGELGSTDITNKLNILLQYGYNGGFFWQDGRPEDQYNISVSELNEIQIWSGERLLVTYQYDINGNLIGRTDLIGSYTYYQPSGRLESVRFVTADVYGNLYYHYTDEAINTDPVTGSVYGNVDYQALAVADGNGALAYTYTYFAGTSQTQFKYCWTAINYADPKAPTVTGLLVTYEYDALGVLIGTTYADGRLLTYYASGRLESVRFVTADVYGNL
ncbi:MAG: cellulase family glycosylhydrolase, partial [Planctomycetota bacterium]